MWTAARLATAASPDNSKYQEAARTCREALGRAAAFLTAADWPPGQSRATSCGPIYHRPTCTTLHHAHGDIITFSISLLETSPVKSKKKNDMKSNNLGPWQQQQHKQKVILPEKIGLASTQSISHQRVYCDVCIHSRGG